MVNDFANTDKNKSIGGGFAKRLNNYLSNPQKRNNPIDVCITPNALIAIGAKQLPVVINPNDIDKCLAVRTANKNKNSHELTVTELNKLPKLFSNPVMIFKDAGNPNYIVIITDKCDKSGNPFIIAMEFEDNQQKYNTNRVASMHGRKHTLENFIANNGNEVKGYIPRNIEKGNLLAININKAYKFLRPTGLQLPEGREFISFDNSITQSLDSVKRIDYEKLNEILNQATKDLFESHDFHYMLVSLSDIGKIKPYLYGYIPDKENPSKAIIKIKKSDISQVKSIFNKNNGLIR